MVAVQQVNEFRQLSWAEAEGLLLQLPDKQGTQVSLNVDPETWMIVEYVGELGYFVVVGTASEHDFFNLIDRTLGDEISLGCLALERNYFPRYAPVGQGLMLHAARTFFEFGTRDPGCDWIPAREATYE